MQEKLNNLSDLIEKIQEKMSPETILLVVGDHGMTEDGNHGGSSN